MAKSSHGKPGPRCDQRWIELESGFFRRETDADAEVFREGNTFPRAAADIERKKITKLQQVGKKFEFFAPASLLRQELLLPLGFAVEKLLDLLSLIPGLGMGFRDAAEVLAYDVSSGGRNSLRRCDGFVPRLQELRWWNFDEGLRTLLRRRAGAHNRPRVGHSPAGIMDGDCPHQRVVQAGQLRRRNSGGKFSSQRGMRWLCDQPAFFVLLNLRGLDDFPCGNKTVIG